MSTKLRTRYSTARTQRFSACGLLCFIVFGLEMTVSSGQKPFPGPPDNLTSSITVWSSNQCCGAAIGFEGVRPNECLTLGPSVDPAVYGNSVKVEGIWNESIFVGWGYANGFTGERCDEGTKIVEWRTPECLAFPKGGRPRSFRWQLETYSFLPPGWGQPWYRRESEVPEMARPSPPRVGGLRREMEVCKEPDWFEYVDRGLGRSRRVEVLGSSEVLERVVGLYNTKDYGALRGFDELL